MRFITSNFAGGSSRPAWRGFSSGPLVLPLIAETRIRVLELQEIAFACQAAGEAAQVPVFPHHPVAGNDDGRGISAGAGPGGADGQRRARPLGQGAIADGFAVGDARDFLPDPALEIGAGQSQREREAFSSSREIFPELLRRKKKKLL